MENPINLTGIGQILADDGNHDELQKLENSIINNKNETELNETQIIEHYRDRLKGIQSSIFSANPVGQSNTQNEQPTNDFDMYGDATQADTTPTGSSLNKDPVANNININRVSQYKPPSPKPQQYNSYNSSYNSYNTSYVPRDRQMKKMTLEEQRQSHINSVLDGIEVDDALNYDIDRECDEDQKAFLVDQIESLRESLLDDNIDISRVPPVDKDSSLVEIKNIYKILSRKNDRNRYCTMAEGMILVGARGMEYIFDGEREILGNKPDLRGWSDNVKVKLRRLKHETSTLVQDIMQDYYLTPIWRIMFELVPDMFLYARTRQKNKNDQLYDEADMNNQCKAAISNLNSLAD